MPTQFAILHHIKPSNEHWDVMLEQGDVLLTWQLAQNPISFTLDSIVARRIQDHRKRYLDYEGPISGDRGEVSRVDRGAVTFLELSEKIFIFSLAGDQLRGQFQLVHVCDDAWIWSVVANGEGERLRIAK